MPSEPAPSVQGFQLSDEREPHDLPSEPFDQSRRSLGGPTGSKKVVDNEKKMGYASIVVATNWAAGMQPKVSHDEVVKVMRRSGKAVKRLIEGAVAGLVGDKR